MAKNNQITTQIIITCNAKNADDEIKRIQATVTELDNKIAKMRKDGADEKEIKFVENLRNAMNNFSRETVTGFDRIKAAIEKLDEQSVNQLRRARRAALQYRDSLSANDAEYAQAEENLKKINTQIDLLTGKQRRLSDATKNFNGTLQNISTASIDKLNEALKDGEVMLNRMSKGEVERAGVVPGMANIRQEIANRRKMSAKQTQDYLYQPFQGGKTWADLTQQQITDRIAVAKESLNRTSQNDPNRSKLTEYIRQAEAQLQKLNGTFVNTDELIKRTFGNANASPKELAEAINLIKQNLDSLPASMTADREKYNQMMADMIQRSRRLRGELVNSGDGFKRIRELVGLTGKEMQNAGEKVGEFPRRLRNLKTVPFDKLREAAKLMREELAKMSESDANFKTMQHNVEKVEAQLEKSTAAVNKHGSAWKTTIKNMMAYVGVFGMLNMVKSKIEEIISLNLKFSQQLADVRKVSGLASSDIKQLGNELAKIDSRTSLQGLMSTAYSGAKLGFGEQGVEGLAQFTRAANVATVAIGEELGEDALPALSKIVENMGIIKKYGIEQSMLKTASAMFKLSSTSTATSNNIVEFSKRLTAMSKVAGITTDQLLALGSASDAMYLSPEVAATAFTKLISSVQTSHNLIEKTLGMAKGTINDLFSKGKAMDAIVQIFEKMHDLGNMNALKPIFKDLGSDGTRLMNVMTAMAKNVDMLKKHLDTSAEAFREGTAATVEYNVQQETAEGLMERAKNLWQKAVMNPDEVDVVHDFAKAWYDVSKAVTTSQFAMWNIRTAISSLMGILESLLYLLPSIITGLGAAGLYRAVLGLATGFRVLIAACSHFSFVWKTMSVATKTGWIGLAATAITALISVLGSLYSSASKAKIALEDMNKAVSNSVAEGRKAALEVDEYVKAINKAAIGSNERAVAIKKFNEKFGAYYKNMLTEKSTAQDIAKAYADVVKHLKEKMLYEGMQKDYEVSVGRRQVSSVYRLQEYDDAYKKTGRTPLHDADWLQAKVKDLRSAGYGSVNNIFKAIIGTVIPTPGLGDNVLKLAKSGATPSGMSQGWGESDSYFNDRKAGLALYRYIAQEVSGWKQETAFKKRWSRKQGEINDWLSFSSQKDDETPGTLDNEAPDKDAIKAAKAAASAARAARAKKIRDANERFKNAKEEATAVVSAIDEYYTLQKEAIEQMYNDGKITRIKADNLKMWLENRRLQIQVEAHKALGGRDNQFEELKNQIGWGYDRVDQSSNSDASEKIIQRFNGPATYRLLASFSGGDGMPDGRSVINDINKKGAEMKLKLTEANGKVIKAVDDYFNQFNVVKDVSDGLAQQLIDMGVVFEKPKNFFKAQEADHKDNLELDASSIELPDVTVSGAAPKTTQMQLLEAFIKNGSKNYGFDASSAQQLGDWLKTFVTGGDWNAVEDQGTSPNKTQFEDWAKLMPNMEAWVQDIPKYQREIQSFYISLLSAEDNYYNKVKSNTDREKLVLEERWSRSSLGKYYEQRDRDLQVAAQVQSIYGRGETGAFLNTQEMARNQGFADNIANDPEVLRIHAQMEAMRQKLALARQTEQDAQAIRDAERAAEDAELAYANTINTKIKERMDLLQQWVDPLQEFSESVGDAFIQMTESARDGQEALREATENMVKTFAKMTIDMIAEQVKMEIKRALFHNQMLKSEEDYQQGMQDTNEQGHQSIFKKLAAFFKKRKKDSADASKTENKQAQDAGKEQSNIVSESSDLQLKAKTELATKGAEVTQKMEEQSSQAKIEAATTDANTTASETQGDVFAGIARGAAKIIGKLGWWGIPLVAVIQGLLMGLLNSALGKLFGGKNKSATTNTKIVSGMLTYDSGNVESFAGAIDKKTYPVVGNDGKVYAAKPTDKLVTGLLTEPIATTVNGVPSLVAERGPEMIIGRETTQALMMARPDIISEIVKFDRAHSGRTYRAYDGGNVAELTSLSSSSSQQETQAISANFVATLQSMMPAMEAFVRQLQRPINAQIGMFGRDGLYDSMNKANRFMRGK